METSVLVETIGFNSTSVAARSSHLSFQSYVLSLASLPDHYAASASAPSNTIDIFDKSTMQGIQTLSGHETATTSLLTVSTVAGLGVPSLVSSGRDGSVKVWDSRSNSHSIKMTNMGKSRALLCCDVSLDGMTVAAGSDLQGEDALIIYWDPRQPAAPLRTHSSTHSDDVTVVAFSISSGSPASHNILLSASSDGLISTSNADEDDEDEAVLNVGNWGCSVAQAGWIYGPSSARIWASSDMETISTWSDELEQLKSEDIRTPSLHNQNRTWVTDYVVGCHSNPTSPGDLDIFVGSNEGDVALVSNMDLSGRNGNWALRKLWTNGHVGVVRSFLWDDKNHVLVTGGEDSKLNVWPSLPVSPPSFHHTPVQEDVSMDVDSSAPRKRGTDWDDDDELIGKKRRR